MKLFIQVAKAVNFVLPVHASAGRELVISLDQHFFSLSLSVTRSTVAMVLPWFQEPAVIWTAIVQCKNYARRPLLLTCSTSSNPPPVPFELIQDKSPALIPCLSKADF